MKKIFGKDRNKRERVKNKELNKYVLKQISSNVNFPKTTNWQAITKLSVASQRLSKTQLTNRCIKTVSRKTFHKLTKFSRVLFIRLAKTSKISGLRKSIW